MKKVCLLLVLLAFLAGCESGNNKKWKHAEGPLDYSTNQIREQEQSLQNILKKYSLDENNSTLIKDAEVLQNLGKGNYLVRDSKLGIFYLGHYYDANLVDSYNFNQGIWNMYTQSIVILKKDGIFKYTTTEGSTATVAKYNYFLTVKPEKNIECMQDMQAVGLTTLPCPGKYQEVKHN